MTPLMPYFQWLCGVLGAKIVAIVELDAIISFPVLSEF